MSQLSMQPRGTHKLRYTYPLVDPCSSHSCALRGKKNQLGEEGQGEVRLTVELEVGRAERLNGRFVFGIVLSWFRELNWAFFIYETTGSRMQ